MKTKLKERAIEKAVEYHTSNNIPFLDNIFRPHSEMSNLLFAQAKYLYAIGKYKTDDNFEKELLTSDIGEYGIFGDKAVPLDFPIQAKTNEKFYVYVKDRSKDNIKKLYFNAKSNGYRNKSDKTSPGYWSSRLSNFVNRVGLSDENHNLFW